MVKPFIAESVRELNILIKINQSIISTLVLEDVLQVISDGMSELLAIESAALYLLQSDTEVHLGATTPQLPPGIPREVRIAAIEDHPHIKATIETHKFHVVDDTHTANLSPSERSIVEMRNLRSLVFLPFILKNEVLGVLILGTCNSSRKYKQHEIELGQAIANQLAVAIQNAKLHEDLKEHRDNLERLVQEKTHDLNAAIEELRAANDELYEKINIIINQNSELKATLQHLKETQSHLLQAEKMASLGTLTAGVAHEINNPLNFIMGAYLGLEKYFNTNPDNQFHEAPVLLNSITSGIERISSIVNSLNQFSQKNSETTKECCIHSIIDNCLIMLNNQIFDRVEIVKEYDANTPKVKGKVANLHHAFLNILTNSLQAIDGKGTIRIKTLPLIGKNKILIEVHDSGKGISHEIIGRVTEPFFTTKDPGKGTGLGLSITYRIIKEHRGEIEFESVANNGTLVRVELPISI